MGAPLEDARHLAQRYDRMRQEAEAQVPLNLASCWRFGYPEFWMSSIVNFAQTVHFLRTSL